MTSSLAESLGGGSPELWAVDFLRAAVFPVTYENVLAVVSWMFDESGGGGGMWNPLNTTQGGYPGETDANTVGVKNYARRVDGLAANARVIHNGLYPDVVAAFLAGTSAEAIARAVVLSPWGTHTFRLRAQIAWPVVAQPLPVPAPPVPLPPEDTMTMLALGVAPNGRAMTARPVKGYDCVLLEDGATVQGDEPNGQTRKWTPAGLPLDSHIVDIAAPGPGEPAGVAFVARYSFPNGDSGTYNALDRTVSA